MFAFACTSASWRDSRSGPTPGSIRFCLNRGPTPEAFGAFLADTTLTANQLNFVNLIVEELTQNGVMPAARLYESPFTDFAPTGPDMLFTDTQVDGIVTILDEVWRHAIADGETAA